MKFLDGANNLYRSFTASGRALFLAFAILLVGSTVGLVYLLNDSLLVSVPAHGGSLTEGIIGSPRFINPVLAISDADRDLSALVYSGLLRATPEGDYLPDLAQEYSISTDGKVYTFTLREDATFHDGSRVTADDIMFTINKIQDPVLKSPARANWDGVLVEKVGDNSVRFTLKSAYAPFIENLTLGIIPKHLWQSVSDEEFPFSNLNTSPIGSGPYMLDTISRTPSGIPSSYDFKPFSKYALGEPYLSHITFEFFQSEAGLVTALKSGEVEAASEISPTTLAQLPEANVVRSPLNRVFGIFFNQNQSAVLRDHDVRKALQDAVDRDDLVAQVLGGYGLPLTSPIPPAVLNSVNASTTLQINPITTKKMTVTERAQAAQQELLAKGWVLGQNGVLTKTTGKDKTKQTVTLSFTLSTGNVPELRAAAAYLKDLWDRVGAQVDVQIFDQGDLSQNVIRPRKYDALLFGEIVGRELDLFAFWHSSQRNDPGLNIALYANTTADKALEELRTVSDDTSHARLYNQFEAELDKDIPAIFLYAPDFVYIVPKDLEGLTLGFIATPSDRFLSIIAWHRSTDFVWPFFVGNTNRNK